jgi:uncharacterized protein (DUF305 family)
MGRLPEPKLDEWEYSRLALVYPSEVPTLWGSAPEGHVRFRLRRYVLLLAVGTGLAGLVWRVTTAVAAGSEVGFFAANDAAMKKMMAGMTIKPTGDIDRDFVAMMVPHHHGAIDMAQAELLYGHNQTLLRIAQEIVVEQQQEIAAMRLAVGEAASQTWVIKAAKPLPKAGAPAPKSHSGQEAPYLNETNAAIGKMMTDMTVKPVGDVDHDFVAMMVPHHQGAIDMAEGELRYGQNQQLKAIAQEIIVDQTQEITLMRLALGEPLPESESAPTQIPAAAASTAPAATSGSTQPRMRMNPGMQMAPVAPNGSH